MDVSNPYKVLNRTIIVTTIIFVIGLLIFFFKNKFVGAALLAGGAIGAIIGVISYLKIKKNDQEGAKKIFAQFNIAGGLIILFLGLLILILSKSLKNIYFEIGIGLLLLVYGLFHYIKNKKV